MTKNIHHREEVENRLLRQERRLRVARATEAGAACLFLLLVVLNSLGSGVYFQSTGHLSRMGIVILLLAASAWVSDERLKHIEAAPAPLQLHARLPTTGERRIWAAGGVVVERVRTKIMRQIQYILGARWSGEVSVRCSPLGHPPITSPMLAPF